MKNILTILSAILLTACTAQISAVDLNKAAQFCASNEGLASIEIDVDIYEIRAICKNSAVFKFKPSNK